MTDKTLEEQGFIKHDGGPMPEYYGFRDIINIYAHDRIDENSIAGMCAWERVEYHKLLRRAGPSNDELFNKAVETITAMFEYMDQLSEQGMRDSSWSETLTLIKQRNPEL